jgi:hypothetical protein
LAIKYPPPPPPPPKHEIAADLKPCQRKPQDNDLKPQFVHLISLVNLIFR